MSKDYIWIEANREVYAANTLGFSIHLEKGEKQLVRRDLAAIAFTNQTAVPCANPNDPTNNVPDFVPEALAHEELKASVKSACEKVMDDGEPSNFTDGGRPTVWSIEAILTEVDPVLITPALVDEVWEEVTKIAGT